MDRFPTIVLQIVIYLLCFIYGAVLGSFFNVVSLRVIRREDFVLKRSHCDSCGYELKWYDLIPIVSYLVLGGKCRQCKRRIPIQHLVMEVLNGILYVLVFMRFGFSIETIIFWLMTSALISLSVIDFQTYEIPFGFPVFITILGIVKLMFHLPDWKEYVIGFFAVSLFLYLLFVLSRGAAIGGGDVKLMAACGLVLGWKLNIFAFIAGCIIGSAIHILRMKLSGEDHVLAMGPYLSCGVLLAVFFGDAFINWYFGLFAMM